jgi:hypothetical protein
MAFPFRKEKKKTLSDPIKKNSVKDIFVEETGGQKSKPCLNHSNWSTLWPRAVASCRYDKKKKGLMFLSYLQVCQLCISSD